MRAHELAAALHPDSEDYKRVMAAAKFDLGKVDQVMELSSASTMSFFEIPAPVCLFHVEGPSSSDFYLAWNEFGGTVWRGYGRDPEGWFRHDVEVFIEPDAKHVFAFRIDQNKLIGMVQEPDGLLRNDWSLLDEGEKEVIGRYITVASAIEVFSCCNVATVEHKPPRFINAKRIAKGKVPFFSYRTLHITSDAAPKKGETATGTHASPRLHLRRGHIRRLPDDRRIWVRASLVGDKSKGFAAKDYSVGRVANNLPATNKNDSKEWRG